MISRNWKTGDDMIRIFAYCTFGDDSSAEEMELLMAIGDSRCSKKRISSVCVCVCLCEGEEEEENKCDDVDLTAVQFKRKGSDH